ncbi:phosphoribosylformylglycinamidine cyclo-ligase [Raoultibacter massiliensis]|uniref:phosphoribosylformylglycinamidine cyclo-ligase n=1 Tax=Raoultibacter massiliensis TaxID=1852371 RepID=UPI003A91E418
MTERITVSAVERDDAPAMPSWAQGATTYAQAGVDTAEGARAVDAIKGAVHETYRDEVIGDIGGFGGLFSIAAAKNMADPILVSGTDGVGTKLKVAQLANKHDTVGIDLVAMCANDILATGAEPLFFLDYVAIGKLRAEAVAEVVSGIAEGCKQAGCALIGGEMAEHPGVMDPDDYDLSGFCVGVVDRPEMLDPKRVQVGDVLVGLASSGLHSNGYSLARKVCVEGKTHYELRLEREELGGLSVEEALLAPTRIYVKQVLSVLRKHPKAVRALAHITGGGISENLDRALPDTVDAEVELGTWDVPPIATFVCNAAKLDETEALKTFNMGLGMVLIVDPAKVGIVEEALAAAGEKTYRVGRIVEGEGKVVYANEGCLFASNDVEEPEVE